MKEMNGSCRPACCWIRKSSGVELGQSGKRGSGVEAGRGRQEGIYKGFPETGVWTGYAIQKRAKSYTGTFLANEARFTDADTMRTQSKSPSRPLQAALGGRLVSSRWVDGGCGPAPLPRWWYSTRAPTQPQKQRHACTNLCTSRPTP
eukprot:345483-Chlamydomonas_euryale.AAC.5